MRLKFLFKELENTLRGQGYCDDEIKIDRMIIEMKTCRRCPVKDRRRPPLRYVGLSIANRYRAFGVCPDCDEFVEFGDERVPTTATAAEQILR